MGELETRELGGVQRSGDRERSGDWGDEVCFYLDSDRGWWMEDGG